MIAGVIARREAVDLENDVTPESLDAISPKKAEDVADLKEIEANECLRKAIGLDVSHAIRTSLEKALNGPIPGRGGMMPIRQARTFVILGLL